jgi:hypothetical protein
MLRIGEMIQLRPYVESSFGIYGDAKSVTEVVIMLGNAPIHANSGNPKNGTRSSIEALSQIFSARELLSHQHLGIGPAILYQGYQSTRRLAE